MEPSQAISLGLSGCVVILMVLTLLRSRSDVVSIRRTSFAFLVAALVATFIVVLLGSIDIGSYTTDDPYDDGEMFLVHLSWGAELITPFLWMGFLVTLLRKVSYLGAPFLLVPALFLFIITFRQLDAIRLDDEGLRLSTYTLGILLQNHPFFTAYLSIAYGTQAVVLFFYRDELLHQDRAPFLLVSLLVVAITSSFGAAASLTETVPLYSLTYTLVAISATAVFLEARAVRLEAYPEEGRHPVPLDIDIPASTVLRIDEPIPRFIHTLFANKVVSGGGSVRGLLVTSVKEDIRTGRSLRVTPFLRVGPGRGDVLPSDLPLLIESTLSFMHRVDRESTGPRTIVAMDCLADLLSNRTREEVSSTIRELMSRIRVVGGSLLISTALLTESELAWFDTELGGTAMRCLRPIPVEVAVVRMTTPLLGEKLSAKVLERIGPDVSGMTLESLVKARDDLRAVITDLGSGLSVVDQQVWDKELKQWGLRFDRYIRSGLEVDA